MLKNQHLWDIKICYCIDNNIGVTIEYDALKFIKIGLFWNRSQ